VLNSSNATVLDVDNRVFYGTVQGSFRDSTGNFVFDEDYLLQSVKGGNIVNNEEVVLLNNAEKWFKGNLLNASGQSIYDYVDDKFISSFRGSLFASDDTLLVDGAAKKFKGTVVGSVVDSEDNIIVDISTGTITGDFVGDVYDSSGMMLLNHASRTLSGMVAGNVVATDGLVIVDAETKSLYGSFVGNVLDDDGDTILDASNRRLVSTVQGDIVDSANNIIVDVSTGLFSGTVNGSVTGTLINSGTGEVVFDIDTNSFAADITANNFVGNLVGTVTDTNGVQIIDEDGNIEAGTISATTITGNLVGDVTGNVKGNYINNDGTTLIDVANSYIKGSIVDFEGNIVVNQQTKRADLATVVTGTLDANLIETEGVRISHNVMIDQPVDGHALLINSLPLTGRLHKFDQAIVIKKQMGTAESPLPVSAGDDLSSIGFGGRTAIEPFDSTTIEDYDFDIAGSIGFRIPDDAELSSDVMPGEFVVKMCDYDGEVVDGLVINANGETTTKLKDLTVVGETGNTPTSSATPSEWLEITVNGNTRYMPIYT